MDPEGNDIFYYADWGDGPNSGWLGPYASNFDLILNHIWSKKGTYTVKAKAKYTLGAESEWATLKVRMPKTYINNPIIQLLMRILDRFPFFEKILN
ncbi:MAG: hypothetical protein MUO82_02480 [Candidatus Thermoplasmatota archaeon]|nr:hypothetical protein [Candidatus Thermoplasmatota archaeon]